MMRMMLNRPAIEWLRNAPREMFPDGLADMLNDTLVRLERLESPTSYCTITEQPEQAEEHSDEGMVRADGGLGKHRGTPNCPGGSVPDASHNTVQEPVDNDWLAECERALHDFTTEPVLARWAVKYASHLIAAAKERDELRLGLESLRSLNKKMFTHNGTLQAELAAANKRADDAERNCDRGHRAALLRLALALVPSSPCGVDDIEKNILAAWAKLQAERDEALSDADATRGIRATLERLAKEFADTSGLSECGG